MSALPPDQLTRFRKLAGMLGSAHSGEAAAAAAAATRLLRQHGATWEDVTVASRITRQHTRATMEPWRETCAYLLGFPDLLSPWETNFVQSLPAFPHISPKQRHTLSEIYERVRWRSKGRAP